MAPVLRTTEIACSEVAHVVDEDGTIALVVTREGWVVVTEAWSRGRTRVFATLLGP